MDLSDWSVVLWTTVHLTFQVLGHSPTHPAAQAGAKPLSTNSSNGPPRRAAKALFGCYCPTPLAVDGQSWKHPEQIFTYALL